jgi:FkbM family methyltransferase
MIMSEFSERIAAYGPRRSHYITELATRFIAEKVIRRGDTVYDLGASLGFHADHFAHLVGDEGNVQAFEPNPAHWGHFTNRPPIRLWPFAVGDEITVETLIIPLEIDGAASIVDPRDFLGGETQIRTVSVPQVTLDSLRELDTGSPTFIKIDIERRELQALRGGSSLISRARPVITYESDTPDIQEYFRSINYTVKSVLPMLKSSANIWNSVAYPREKTHLDIDLFPTAAELAGIVDTVETGILSE